MSNESENDFDEMMEATRPTIMATTQVVFTPEIDTDLGLEGSFWAYSHGMKDNHDLPDLEIRGIPGMFVSIAGETIKEISIS